MNIFSGSTDGEGLAASLTNCTVLARRKGRIKKSFPVKYRGRVWPDAEAAYLRLSHSKGEAEADALMVELIVAKFRQHPDLALEVQRRGGTPFLLNCRHFTHAQTERFRAWEGVGLHSRFIRNLVKAYEVWLTTS